MISKFVTPEVVIDLAFLFGCRLKSYTILLFTSTVEANVDTEVCLVFHYCVVQYPSAQYCDLLCKNRQSLSESVLYRLNCVRSRSNP